MKPISSPPSARNKARSPVHCGAGALVRGRPIAARACVLLLLSAAALCETRPRYGGTLRVQIRESVTTPEPPQTGPLAELTSAFTVSQWDPGRRAVYSADDNAPGGRPFLDTVEVQMGRPLRDQSIDLNLGRADLVELDPGDPQRPQSGRRVWSSAPVRLLALVFSPRVDDARIREALALSVDRTSIHTVLMQRQGEIAAGLLPQWLSGYSFVFQTATDVSKARALASAASGSRTLSLGVADPANRRIADRIALNARDAGLTVIPSAIPNPDVRLLEARIVFLDPALALASVAAALGLPQPSRADSPEALYLAERGLLEGYRVIPLLHLPDVYGVSPRVRGGPGITPGGEWRFESLWVEGRP